MKVDVVGTIAYGENMLIKEKHGIFTKDEYHYFLECYSFTVTFDLPEMPQINGKIVLAGDIYLSVNGVLYDPAKSAMRCLIGDNLGKEAFIDAKKALISLGAKEVND